MEPSVTPQNDPPFDWAGGLRQQWLMASAVCLSLVSAVLWYPQLPETVPELWNPKAVSPDFSSRAWVAFFPPAVMAILLVFSVRMPRTMPSGNPFSLWRRKPAVQEGLFLLLWWGHHLRLVQASQATIPWTHVLTGLLGIVAVVVGRARAGHPGAPKSEEAAGVRAGTPATEPMPLNAAGRVSAPAKALVWLGALLLLVASIQTWISVG